jgi:hypothetical protein
VNRKLWMAQRNIRSIRPWKLMQILGLFEQANLSDNWETEFKDLLELKNLKKDYESYHSNPGGNRTYRSQLEALGLIYRKQDQVEFTKAGDDLKNGNNPLGVLQSQLLRMQYPSVYSLSQNVNIDPDIKVKPVLFLLQLLKHFDYLTRDEVSVAVIYGHNHHNAFERCCEKIDLLRAGTHDLQSIIDDNNDVYTTKTLKRTLAERFKEIRDDIANTFENWAESAQLISWQEMNGERVNVINPSAVSLVDVALGKLDDFVEVDIDLIKQHPIAFSRKFGTWYGVKDTRRTTAKVVSKKLTPEQVLLRDELYERMGDAVLGPLELQQYKECMIQLGLTSELIDDAIQQYAPSNLSIFEDQYIRLSNSGKSADGILFEKATVELLKRINKTTMLTGQLRRPAGAGSYADIVLTHGDSAMLIDTKASPAYSLPHADKAKAVTTYIPAWEELRSAHSKTNATKLNNLCYVAGGFIKQESMNKKLEELKTDSNSVCAVNAIRSYSLLKFVKVHDDSAELFKLCQKTGLLDLTDA